MVFSTNKSNKNIDAKWNPYKILKNESVLKLETTGDANSWNISTWGKFFLIRCSGNDLNI